METCQMCGKSYPDGSLFTVIIDRSDSSTFAATGKLAITKQELCRPCMLEAGQGMDRLEINVPAKKKWWELWK